jgi:hypothetical protein
MAWYDPPDGWDVAGYDDVRGDWQDVWNGDPSPSPLDLEMADQVVLHTKIDGEDFFTTIHGGFDEDFTIEDAVDDTKEAYGIE